jgi:hypothetical protein
VKKIISLFYTNLFLTRRLFAGIAGCVVFFVLSFFFPWLGVLPQLAFWALVLLVLIDALMLYLTPNGVFAKRHAPDK